MRNGYFRLDMRSDGVYVKLFPEVDGGAPISIKELTEYLQAHKLTGFDLKELNAAIQDKSGSAEVKVSPPVSYFVNETMTIDVSMDQMTLTARFYPNSEGGSRLDFDTIVNDLRFKKVRFGIKEEEINKFLTDRAYCTDYVLAEGKKARFGKDASIEYFFNTRVNLKPKTNEDGSVDFHNLDIVSPVEAGQLLARLTPADPGEPGTDVYGSKVNPPTVKNRRLEYGHNIRISEDQTELYTEVTGHASLVNGRVFVSDVYEVPADVANATGNIDYPGNVHVKGSVKSGFSVKASGDVIIDGVVEGAEVVSGGQIVVRAGIHGMGKGVLIAKSNILCKFIENATAKSEGGYVAADMILHSRVEARDEIRVSGKKGNITGGSVRAGKVIDVNYLGTDMGANTEVEVGCDPAAVKRMNDLTKEEKEISESLEKIKPILVALNQKMRSGEPLDEKKQAYFQTLAQQFKSLQTRYAEITPELADLKEQIGDAGTAKVVVHRTAYPGVTIKIGSASTTLKSKRDYCTYVYEAGDVTAKVL